jgi:hypothetical protein
LLLGLIPATKVVPDLQPQCLEALDALAELPQADGTWSRFANADAVNIAALAAGVKAFPEHPRAAIWKATARRAADAWLSFTPVPGERSAPTPHLVNRKADGTGMTFFLGQRGHPHIPLYVGGHWLHALADLHAVTGEPRYADRANALLAYYCGHNPLRVRLLNELGAVNNRVTDRDHDGIEETLNWDGYPESTAFVQIGLLHWLTQRFPKTAAAP